MTASAAARPAPTPVDLCIDARWIVPIEPAGVLAQHTLVVDGGRIVAVAPTDSAQRDYAPRDHVSLPAHVLLPGLVNAHTHAAMALLRGIADDVALKTWLEQHIWPREARLVSPDFVHDGTLVAAGEMLLGGITCCADQYFFPDAAARAYRQSGMRALIGLPILDFPTSYAADADGYLQVGLAARDAWKHEPKFAFALAPHAPYTVGDRSWEKIVVYARQLDLPIQTHVQETRDELEQGLRAHAMSPLARLDRLGVTGPNFIAVHAVHLRDSDVELLAAQSCHVVHCPGSNLKLASGIAPVVRLKSRGVNVALGSDGAASNNRLDVLGEARLAALVAKVATGDAAALPAGTALRMATLDGAAALGLDAEIGSLFPGKQADAIAVSLAAFQHAPCYDPVSHLVHVLGRDQVTDVWIAGKRIVCDAALVSLDAAELVARARLWQDRVQ
jgi:5-methylthioadenosine/S-adenosylhomocysteine deaminase